MKKIFFAFILFSALGFSQSKGTSLPDLNTLTIDSIFTVKPIHFNPNSTSNYSFTINNPNYSLNSNSNITRSYNPDILSQSPNIMMQYKTNAFSSTIGYNFSSIITFGLLNSIFN